MYGREITCKPFQQSPLDSMATKFAQENLMVYPVKCLGEVEIDGVNLSSRREVGRDEIRIFKKIGGNRFARNEAVLMRNDTMMNKGKKFVKNQRLEYFRNG
ncbi:hypothetical protein M8J77_007794 [Diaphorina citri]|nr:hypothetical protein M8J77_007794 [Diaphorina citri]